MKPLIGVTPDTHSGRKIKTRTEKENIVYLWDQYLNALLQHNATPVVLPVTEDPAQIRAIASRLDGVLLSGGNFDVPPEFFGEEKKPWCGWLKPKRSRFELALFYRAVKMGLPVLGICGGMQAINVALGGTLYQDIATERPESRNHQQKPPSDKTFHKVVVNGDTKLGKIVTGRRSKSDVRLSVNSTHHQAVKDVAPRCVFNAVAADGLVEGIETEDDRFILGVQWHPELLFGRFQAQSNIFKAFVRAAKKRN